MRIGILGGSFDPPHVVHLIIALHAQRQLKLDRLYLIPAAIPPHRRLKTVSSPGHRLGMTRLLVRGIPGMNVLDLEIRRGGRSYTVDTLRAMRRRHPRASMFFLVGSDNYRLLNTWKDPDIIRQLAVITVYPRGGIRPVTRKLDKRDRILRGGPHVMSSTEIRRLAAASKSIEGLVTRGVERYIHRNCVYAAQRPRGTAR
ncbi:MAG: nicotinate (nicotinamide) nucleotide adenylyltransferase [Ignavibacteria bacterium GWA2_55_11]|nr:MAG: nicotinate (nicotinamide) nucleotide adenylyltransferase [Ignavibacteria bacterium GWA2_55_11]